MARVGPGEREGPRGEPRDVTSLSLSLMARVSGGNHKLPYPLDFGLIVAAVARVGQLGRARLR